MKKFYKKMAERAAKTFIQVFLVTFAAGIVNIDVFKDLGAVQALAVSAAAAGLSAVSSALSKNFGPEDTPSLV